MTNNFSVKLVYKFNNLESGINVPFHYLLPDVFKCCETIWKEYNKSVLKIKIYYNNELIMESKSLDDLNKLYNIQAFL